MLAPALDTVGGGREAMPPCPGVWSEDPLTTHIHADGLGSIVAMTDSNGNVTSRRQYDAWGNLEVGADQPGYAFTGREWDPETGLYYYRARYYDPKVGRFISEDPIGFAAGVNFYAYAENNPPQFIDPNGLEVRVYSSTAFGVIGRTFGLNHAFVYSTETGRGKGTDGSLWVTTGDGVGDLDSPYVVAVLPPGMSETEFMDRVEQAHGWNNWVWLPWVNDCHTDLENAFKQAGVPYPGAPNDEMDLDDNLKAATPQLVRRYLFPWRGW